MLLIDKKISRGICHTIYRYGKANNKYVKNYDESRKLSYIKYWKVNNLYV